ncbi:NUDIX hydrolase [Acetobacter sp. TBRC 12305]|uniref:NUDIX hydrolase n=2 Tax=Acetobacter garciniae TaxID=2817435 RepID=A0A939KM37_9PROT|nr:NUDIX hydrolase [Acetobacter garciniae]MBX0344584.1 NUDIX hydrolase [Acetobacter garciniae]
MTPITPPPAPRLGVLSVVRRDDSFLLVRRAKAPDAGLWGFPGGKVEAGETLFAAAQRELLEETALHARATRIVSVFDSLHHTPDGTLAFHYVIVVIRCAEPQTGQATLRAGDDALEAQWFTHDAIRQMGSKASARLLELVERIMTEEKPGPDGTPAQGL